MNEETDLNLHLSVLRDEEEYFREQCLLLMEQGNDARALHYDEMANDVSDKIKALTG